MSDKNGTHWWSILDLHPRKEIFLTDNFGITGLKSFIIQDDKNQSIRSCLELEI